ncbi:MAG: hypothetical protein KKA84_09450 [Bacteroidetes bacterium]|nr:hypothetical protein [Bacteroidota bacterium]
MKKVIYLSFFLFLLVPYYSSVKAQASIDLIVFTPLPAVDFAAFAFADIPGGNLRIFEIRISPAGERVVLQGVIEWKKDANSSFQQLFRFETYAFLARSLTNQDLGRGDIRIKTNDSNNQLAEENLRKGKPSGEYRISLTLKSPEGLTLGSDSEVLSFLNPSQTISIRSPEANSNQDIGSVILQWDNVIGAGSYKILANIRRNESQSLEEALTSGTPIIDRVDVGSLTVTNLRRHFTREPLPGQEVVVQVIAVIDGPGGGEELYSDIINFYIGNNSSPETEALRQRMVSVFSALANALGSDFLDMLRSGEIDISTIRIVDDTGRTISFEELQQIMIYLQSNPDAIIDVDFMER